ncbi:MAG: glycerol-3-phosphate 1-O-acyltransferase PlsY [Firmicutes bacterium]|nr:glycerol-3-phosphate 1-O-acyltransferase PlsY [Bacillota bacterium]
MVSFLAVMAGYLIGSLPVGYVIAQAKGFDIREHGSGNIGTTNVWRNLGPVPGIITLIGDILKGVLALLLGTHVGGQNLGLLCGLAAIAGHSWPLFLRFKGGKIIATSLGVLIGFSYETALLAAAVWLITVAISKYVSLGSIIAAISVPIWMLVLKLDLPYLIFGTSAAVFAIFKHRSNMKRILAGTEFKVGQSKKL